MSDSAWAEPSGRVRHRLAAGQPPAVGLEQLTVSYDGVAVVAAVDLQVERGEWVSVIGPNGAGKSSLL